MLDWKKVGEKGTVCQVSVPVCLVSSCNYMELVLRAAANGGRCLLFWQKVGEKFGGKENSSYICGKFREIQ